MKTKLILCILIFCALSSYGQQPDWKSVDSAYMAKYKPIKKPDWLFPFVFQDDSNVRDTIYFVIDSLASSADDSTFGEYNEGIANNKFQAYIFYSLGKIGKVQATTISDGGIGEEIQAQNYTYPINLWWNSSRLYKTNNNYYDFKCSLLSSEYYYLTKLGGYDLHESEELTLYPFSFGSGDHFPIGISFSLDTCDRGDGINDLPNTKIRMVNTGNACVFDQVLEKITVYSLSGQLVVVCSNTNAISIEQLVPGFYLISYTTRQHQYYTEKVFKTN